MTNNDLYPCTNCGRDNLYPGPCASCEHFIHPPAFDVTVAANIKPLAVELGRQIMLSSETSRVVCYDCRKPCNGTCPASRGEPADLMVAATKPAATMDLRPYQQAALVGLQKLRAIHIEPVPPNAWRLGILGGSPPVEDRVNALRAGAVRAAMPRKRTDLEIVEQTNTLAREFYSMLGYTVPATHRFYDFERPNYHPQEKLCWTMACHAQRELTGTDPDDALANLED